MTLPYSKIFDIRNYLFNLNLKSFNYGQFEDFFIKRPTLAPITIVRLSKGTDNFSILVYPLYLKNNVLIADKHNYVVVDEDEFVSIMDSYSILIKQYTQILELKKIKRDFL